MVTDTAPSRSVLERLKRPLLLVVGAGYVLAGVMHFVAPML